MRCLFCILLLLPGGFFSAQIRLYGFVSDEKGEPLPFANIGIKNRNTGTCADARGAFSLTIPQQFLQEYLSCSVTGYTDFHVRISSLNPLRPQYFRLKEQPYQLQEVTIVPQKLLEKIRDHPL